MKNIKINTSVGRLIIVILMLTIVIVGGTFAWFTYRSKESALVLSIGDINDSKVIINPYQIRSTMAPVNTYLNGVYSQVQAINNSGNDMSINLFYRVNQLDDTLINSGLKYTVASSTALDGEYTEVTTGDFTTIDGSNEIVVLNTEINSNTTQYYRVYIWLDSSAGNQVAVQNTTLDLELNGTINLFPNAPVLDEGMIPVVISNDGTVTTVLEDDPDWYDYKKKEWANIVLVSSSSRSSYLNTEDVVVSQSDILAYYVWIPRYRYQIWTTGVSSTGNEQSINIQFESKTDPMTLGTTVGTFRTHPAFWWDDDSDNVVDDYEMLPGIWVAKFETTGSADNLTVLPNTSSLVSQTVSAQFATSLKFAGGVMDTSTGEVTFNGSSTYGLTNDTDSHMMKNSEWGAIAYLSHSGYGINDEVRINNYYNEGTLTGCGALTADATVSTTCEITYGQASSYPQSTTGNITGIFDMSGGMLEYVMGNYNDSEGSSGFSTFPSSKYYDKYTITSIDSCTLEICGGHVLFETSGWYGDEELILRDENYPWYIRGGEYSVTTAAGIFYYNRNSGNTVNKNSFRSVLVPLEMSTVVFDPNEGTLSSTSGLTQVGDRTIYTKNVAVGSIYGTLPTVTRDGYEFFGWYDVIEIGDVDIAARTDTNYNYVTVLDNVYPGVTYTITMDSAVLNSGTATQFDARIHDKTTSTTLHRVYVSFGNDISITLKCPEDVVDTNSLRIIIYAGVAGSTSGNDVTYNNIKIGTNGTTNTTQYTSLSVNSSSSNKQLFAQWELLPTYTISYNMNGGSGTIASQTKTHGVDLTLSSTKPTRDGYTFLGWSTSSSATSATYSAGGTYMANSDTTLYAVWEKLNYTLPTLNSSYPADTSATYNYGSAASATFSVAIATDGNPASYTYQWYLNGSKVSGATSSSYTATSLTEGSYTVYCVVTNAAGSVTSRTATVTVTTNNLTLINVTPTSAMGASGDYAQNQYYVSLGGLGGSTFYIQSQLIDLTNFSSITINTKAYWSKMVLYVINSSGTTVASKTVDNSEYESKTTTLSITNITGNCRIKVTGYGYESGNYVGIRTLVLNT